MPTLDDVTEAYTRLYHKLERTAYRNLCQSCRDSVEDVLQWAYIKAIESIHTLRDPAKLDSWLYVIVRKRALDISRHVRKHGYLPSLSDAVAVADPSPDPEKVLLREHTNKVLYQAVDSLPMAQKRAIRHLLAEGRLCDYPLSTKRVASARGREKLKAMLQSRNIGTFKATGY